MTSHSLLLFLVTILLTLPARAAEIVWVNTSGGSWHVATNWIPQVVPGAADVAVITNSGTYVITQSQNSTVAGLIVGGESGTPTLRISSQILTINGTATINTNAILELASGNIAGSGDVTVSGTLNWSSGTMSGSGRTIIASGAIANLTANNTKGLNRTLDNNGTIHYSGQFLTFGVGAAVAGVINNAGVFNVSGEGDFNQSSSAAHAFNNTGTFNKSGTGAAQFNGVAFNQNGTVGLTGGTLSLFDGGTINQPLEVPAGTRLELRGTFAYGASGVLSGAGSIDFETGTHNIVSQFLPTGTVNFSGGTITIGNTMPVTTVTLSGATVTFNAAQTIPTFTISSGTLAGSGDVTVSGTFNWSSGTMSGSGRTIIASGAIANLTANNTKGLNRTLDNNGTIHYSGQFLTFGVGAAVAGVINNAGVFNVSGEGDFNQSSSAAHAFNNTGTFNKSGTGAAQFNGVAFNQNGTVGLTGGTLSLFDGGTINQPLEVPAGTRLELRGTFAYGASGVLSGAGSIDFETGTHNIVSQFLPTGTVNFSGGTITIGNTMPVTTVTLSGATVTFNAAQTIPTFTISSGTLAGSGDVTVSGTFNWSSGTMSGSGRTIIASGATANLTANNTKGLNRTLDNNGTIHYSGQFLTFGVGAAVAGVINNAGVFNVSGEGDFNQSSSAAHAFNNTGTFNKSGTGAAQFNGVAFNQNGTVGLTGGTLSLFDGGTINQPLEVPAGTRLELRGTFAYGASGVLSGAGSIDFETGTHNIVSQFLPTGTVNFSGGTITIGNTMPVTTVTLSGATVTFNAAQTIPTFTISSGTLAGSGDVTVSGTFNWSSGTMSGSGRTIIASGATANLTANNTKGLNRTLDNNGTIHYSGQFLTFGVGAAVAGVINNAGVFNVSGEGDFNQSSGAAHAFNNTGTLRKIGAGTVTEFSAVALNQAGNLAVESGTLRLNSISLRFAESAALQLAPDGTLNLSPGNLTGPSTNEVAWTADGRLLFDGGGTRLLEIMSRDLGNIPSGYTNNFAYGTLQLTAGLTLVLTNGSDNVPGSEALYLDTLIVPANSTLNLAGLPVYVRNTQISGVVTNGVLSVTTGEQFADLQVPEVSAPAQASVGSSILVEWTVRNTTNASAETPVSAWQDRIILSTDMVAGNPDDRILATIPHAGTLARGDQYQASATVTLPANSSGDLFLFVLTDSGNVVYEFGYETNNFSAASLISIATPDLTPLSFTAGTATAGATIPLTWIVTNLGPAVANADWSDFIYISHDEIRDSGDTFLGAESVATISPLVPGGSYTKSRNVTLPAGTLGSKFLLLVVDGSFNQLEGVETNNTLAIPIEIGAADLLVTDLEVTPATPASGGQVVVRWNSTNAGVRATSGSWFELITVSNLTTGTRVTEASVYYDANLNGPITNGQARARSYSFRLPDGPPGAGDLRFRVRTDSGAQIAESNAAGTGEQNNEAILHLASALANYPDLIVTNLTLQPAAPQSGERLTIHWHVANIGTGPARNSFHDRVVVRNTNTVETLVNTTLFYDVNAAANGPIEPASSRARSFAFQLAAGTRGAGQLEISITTDAFNASVEFNGTNSGEANNSATIHRSSSVAPAPDLVIENILAPATAIPGQPVDLTWTLRNQGNATATNTGVEQIFLSTDLLPGNDRYVAGVTFASPLAAGASITRTERVTIPSFGVGSNYFLIVADGGSQVFESVETNNAGFATNVTLLPATLNLTFSSSGLSEGGGSNAAQGTVVRNTDSAQSLTVLLSSSDTNQIRVPTSVTIPAGQSAASFPISAVENNFVDGDRNASVSVSAAGFVSVTGVLQVRDNDRRELILQLGSASIAENAGTSAAFGYITRNADTNVSLLVQLQSDDTSKATVPASVTLGIGERSASFPIAAVDNDFLDGTRRVNLQASASNYASVSVGLDVTDNDNLVLALSIANSDLVEGSAQPTVATVTRSLVNSRDQVVLLSASPSGQLTLPPRVTIPANQASVSFNVSVPDDQSATGARTVGIVAKPLSEFGRILESGTGSLAVQVQDNDGATLTLTLARAVVAEGASVVGTVMRNSPTNGALTVNLSSSAPTEAQVPASITIPAGQRSANFDVMGVADNVSDGIKSVNLTATSAGHNDGLAALNVSDVDVPDLRVTNVVLPTNGFTDARLTLSWEVSNDGLAAANGSWTDRVYISQDNQLGGDTLIGSATFNGPLSAGQSYSRSNQYSLPSSPGDFWILVVTDSGANVTEGAENNNVRAVPLTVLPAFYASVETDVEVAANGTVIPLRGRVFSAINGAPAPFKLVTTRVQTMGTRRIINSVADAEGNFTSTFRPLPTEAGQYVIGAAHPLVIEDPAQDQFTLLGMRALPERAQITVIPNQAGTGRVELRNLSEIPLVGVSAVAQSLPAGVSVQTSITNELGSLATAFLNYTITTTISQAATFQFVLDVTSSEGARLLVPVSVTVSPLRPQLTANPPFLRRGILRGTQTLVSVEVSNKGGAVSGDLAVALPNVPWITLISPASIPSIAPGEKATVTLSLNPPSDLPLARYDGNIAFSGSAASLSVPFQFRAISEAVGDLSVSVTDEYTYFVAEAPRVTNATVRLRDAISSELIAEGRTDATGQVVFTNVMEGSYSLEATAPKHSTFRGPVTIVPGITNTAEPFLSRQTVTYQYTVVPVEIQDTYRVVLESVFETEVPIPNVIVENPNIMPMVVEGQETQFEIRIRNEGLIAANRVRVNVPQDPRYIITPLVEEIGVLPAKASMTIPVTIRHRDTPRGARLGLKGNASSAAAGSCELDTHDCLPKLPLGVGYSYVCGPNNVQQVRQIDLTPLCVAQSTYKCLEKLLGVAEAAVAAGNLLKAPCEVIDAILQCAGIELSECEKAALQTACKTVVGAISGGLAGAAAGFVDGIKDSIGCICDLISAFLDWLDLSVGDVTLRGSNIQGTPSVHFTPIFPIGGSSTSSCDTDFLREALRTGKKPGRASEGEVSPGAVCARVRIRLEQEAVMSRTAFLGTLEIDNDGGAPITGIQVTLDFRDEAGNSVPERFAVRGPQLSGLSDVNGAGEIGSGASGSAQFTFIPTREAAPMQPTIYRLGGTLRYIEDGQEVVAQLLSSTITVFPEARLELKYFQQRDVYSDDPFTPELEPAEPFALGILAKNLGAGAARNFRITSAQPKIIENEKGLLIDFKIIGTQVGTQAFAPTLTANFGNIPPGESQVAQWLFTSSLQGKFTEYSASFEHIDSLGSANLSLIESVEIHELIHPVRTDRPGDDSSPDFLVNDAPDEGNLPDTLYLSDGTIAVVALGENASVDGAATPSDGSVQLTATMPAGWTYLKLPNPGSGLKLARVVRSDGRELRVGDNVWTTDRSFPSSQSGARREHLLHVLDFNSTGAYTLHFRPDDSIAPGIIDLVEVAPDPRSSAVESIDVQFSEPIDLATFNFEDIRLTLNGGANLADASVTVAPVGGNIYRIAGLAALTTADGNYQFNVLAGGIRDLSGNATTNSAADAWAKATGGPVVVSLESVLPDPRNTAISTLDVVFSQPVDPASFDQSDIVLTRNGGPNLGSSLTVAALNPTTFRVGGLGSLTAANGVYRLSILGSGVNGEDASAGSGSLAEDWIVDTTEPAIANLEQLENDVRNTVVTSLEVTFSEAINAATFDFRDLQLTRNGGANLASSSLAFVPVNATTYRITGLGALVGAEGNYTLAVNASGISDTAGNPGTGSLAESWTMDFTTPAAPANLAVVPDLGIAANDGLINTNLVVLTGTVLETNVTVRVFDVTSSSDLGVANVTGSTFAHALNLEGAGNHRIRTYTVDGAGNISGDAFLELFLDEQAPVLSLFAVGTPRTNAVQFVEVATTEPIDTNTFDRADLTLTRDGATNDLIGEAVSVSLVGSNVYRINGLGAVTEEPGVYLLTVDSGGIADLAGNVGQGSLSNQWQRLGFNTAPQLAAISNQAIEELNLLTFAVAAADFDQPTNTLSFSLVSGAPIGAAIDPASGVFTWTPAEIQGPGLYSISVRVADNGSPSLSATQTFFVNVTELNQPPVLNGLSNRVALVEVPLVITNLVFDSDIPANRVTYALGTNAPLGARINPTNGVLTWTPGRADAGRTNSISVIAMDDGSPALADVKTFTIFVGDYLDLMLGSTVVQAGGNSSIPFSVSGNVDATNLAFSLRIPAGWLTNVILQLAGAPTGSLVANPTDPEKFELQIGSTSAPLPQNVALAELVFTAVSSNVTSAFLTAELSDLIAQEITGAIIQQAFTRDGRIVVIASAPLVEAFLEGNAQREVVIYGKPGVTYTLQSTSDLNQPDWQLVQQITLTNQSERVSVTGTNQALFYRAVER